jgi:hypothetical protein
VLCVVLVQGGMVPHTSSAQQAADSNWVHPAGCSVGMLARSLLCRTITTIWFGSAQFMMLEGVFVTKPSGCKTKLWQLNSCLTLWPHRWWCIIIIMLPIKP